MRETMAFLAAAAVALAGTARAAEPPKKTPELIAKGEKAFATNCASCHGPKGLGDGVAATALNPRPTNLAAGTLKHGAKPAEVFDTLGKGMPGTAMIAFKHLPEEDRWAIAYYVSDLRAKAPKAKK